MEYIKLLLGGVILASITALLYFFVSFPFQYKLFRKMYEHDVQSKMKILLDRGEKEEVIKEMRPSQPVIDHFAWQYVLSLIAITFLGVLVLVAYFYLASYLLTEWLGFSHFWADFTKYIFMIQLIVPFIILEIGYFIVYLYFNRYVKKAGVYGYRMTFNLDDLGNFARTWLVRMENHESSSYSYFRRTTDPTIGICYIIFFIEVVVMLFIRLFS